METLLVNAGGVLLIGTIVWWFWLSGSDSDKTGEHQHH
jgi:plastocyanin domain-containing protein